MPALFGGGGQQPTGQTTTTQTQNTAPWSTQQPYLQQGFSGAQNLYNNYQPQYYPGSTYAAPNQTQYNSLTDLWNQANSLLTGANPTLQNAQNFSNQLETGQTLQNNPSINPLMNMSGNNVGTNNLGTGTLQNLAGGNLSGYNAPYNALTGLAGNNAAYSNPAYGSLSNLANNGVSGVNEANNLALPSIGPSQQTLSSGLNPAMSDLGSYASGGQTDPFLNKVAQSTLASVVPSIESQFIQGGDLSSPQAAYATSQGASAALAPVLSNAYQQEQQNQITAGGMMGDLGIRGAQAQQGLSLNPASVTGNLSLGQGNLQSNTGLGLGNQILGGQSLQQSGQSSLLNSALGLGNLQYGAAGTLGNQALTGAGLQTTQLNDAGNQYNAGVEQQVQGLQNLSNLEQSLYSPAQQEYGAGSQLQNFAQNTLNADVNKYNYYQTLPYQQLAQYLASVSGNYGGTSTGSTSQPYYVNQGANALSGALGGGLLGSQLLGPSGLNLLSSGTGGGVGAVAGALLTLLSSDRQLKRDIQRIGTLHNGLPIYQFRFWGDPRLHVGLMADEVRKIHPEAVIVGPYGFDLVNYEGAMQ